DWYVPLVRKLSRAGWEPVRGASVEGTNVSSERFGSGSAVYLTLYNDGAAKSAATVRPDFAALGFKPDSVKIAEIGRNTPVRSGENGALTLELEPKKTYVLEISSANPTLTLGQLPKSSSVNQGPSLAEQSTH
ncbi:MAG TPA: hypothetical protein VNB29_02310, partial [Chthoniobacterales bacterium]|nr:hypothetical protein [Chthoniobacterales bacterium]